jgi:hypothetical protein
VSTYKSTRRYNSEGRHRHLHRRANLKSHALYHVTLFSVSVRDMCECQSDDADVPLRPSCGVPEVLREDDPDGSVSTVVAPALCHLPREDSPTEAEWRHGRGRPSADVSVALLCGQQVLGGP